MRIVHMWIDGDHRDQITAAVHYGHFHMIVYGSLMKSFTGFVQHGVLSWVPVWFVEVEGAIFLRRTEIANAESDRQEMTTTALKGYRIAVLYILGRFE